MMIEGVDFANERPSGAALAAAGKAFVVRYLSPNTTGNPRKKLTPAEVADYRGASRAICVVWETTTWRARDGRAAGVADAHSAVAAAAELGFPADQPIYFAVDEDTSGSAVEAYFRGVASVIGSARTGVYGSYRVVKYLMSNGICGYGWQTYAWSGGLWYGPAQAQQYRNGQEVPGIPGMKLDLCRATVPSYGQWPPPNEQPEDDVTPAELLSTELGSSGPTVGIALQDGYNDGKALAAAVAALTAKVDALPTTAAPAGPLSDDDVKRIAVAVLDEQHRRDEA